MRSEDQTRLWEKNLENDHIDLTLLKFSIYRQNVSFSFVALLKFVKFLKRSQDFNISPKLSPINWYAEIFAEKITMATG